MSRGADRGRRTSGTRSDDEQWPAGADQPRLDGTIDRSPGADHLIPDADRSQPPPDIEEQWMYEVR